MTTIRRRSRRAADGSFFYPWMRRIGALIRRGRLITPSLHESQPPVFREATHRFSKGSGAGENRRLLG